MTLLYARHTLSRKRHSAAQVGSLYRTPFAAIVELEMAEHHDESLEKRVERLEARVRELQQVIRDLKERPVRQPAGTEQTPARTAEPAKLLSDEVRTSEYWLNKIGIALFLLGVIFLFKYSIEQGWLTPAIRVVVGLTFGIGLLLIALRIAPTRRHFSQVLSGGGIATFYVTGFAAFQLYGLISYPLAFACMFSVTALTFWISIQQDHAVLSLIGAAGGLGTPFLLYTGAGEVAGLVLYTSVILIGTAAIYSYRGWRSLLWTSYVGAWTVFWVGYFVSIASRMLIAPGDQWILQTGVIFTWILYWVLPFVKEPILEGGYGHTQLMTFSSPLIALGLSMAIWELSDKTWGWIAIGACAVYALISGILLPGRQPAACVHVITSAVLLSIGMGLLLEGDVLLLSLAAEAAALHFIGHRLSSRMTAAGGYALFLIVGLSLMLRLSDRVGGAAVVNGQALADLGVIAAIVAASLVLPAWTRDAYCLGAHIAFLAWFVREFSILPNGAGYTTIAWVIYASLLLVIGLRQRQVRLRQIAMATLMLSVGKLLLFDLVRLEAIWRILLFLGAGGFFLLLSYYLPFLWRTPSPGR